MHIFVIALWLCIVLYYLSSTGPIDRARITPDSSTEFLEGVEQEIFCSVTYKCPKDRPYITWNNGELSGSTSIVSGAKQKARSTLKFTAKAGDQRKVITCQSELKGNTQTATITLKVKHKLQPVLSLWFIDYAVSFI